MTQPSFDYKPWDDLGEDMPDIVYSQGQRLPLGPSKVPAPKKPSGPSIQIGKPLPPIGTLANQRDTGVPRAFLLQKWITVRGTSPITTIVQQDSLWRDLSTYADAAFWVEVSEVTGPGSGTVSLTIESSPTWDEANFKPVAPPLVLTPGVVPFVIRCLRTPSTVPLSRWTRWKLTASTTGTWDATLRIRGTAGYSNFMIPTFIKDCWSWLRADAGVTLSASNVTAWADLTGNGNSALSGASPPTFNANPIGGQPTISFNASSSQWMQHSQSITPSPSVVHAFVVHRRSTATETVAAHTGFWKKAATDATKYPDVLPGNQIVDDAFSNATHTCGTPVVDPSVPHVYEVVADVSTWANLMNGKPQFSVGHTFAHNGAGYIGGSFSAGRFYPGDWAELVFYKRILTTAERGLLIAYFNGRYGHGQPSTRRMTTCTDTCFRIGSR